MYKTEHWSYIKVTFAKIKSNREQSALSLQKLLEILVFSKSSHGVFGTVEKY